jgi:predicted NBD/HSP70 family sugar kinase
VGWDGYPLAERLELATDLPFVIDNDVNLAALAHAWRGDGRLVDHFVTFSIGTGTGAAIISGGRLLQGRNNAAGEVAYLLVRPEQLGRQVVDSLGAFESIVSGPGIAARAAARLASSGSSVLGEAAITPETVLAAAAAGDEVGLAVVAGVLDDLAMALVAVICVVDPELIILEGGVGRELGAYLDQLHERIAPSVPSPPRIAISRLGRDATVIGATAAALELARRRAAPAAVSGAFNRTGVGRLPADPGPNRSS